MEEIEKEIVKKKGAPTTIRFTPEELAMIEIIRRITGAPTRSEAIRHAIRTTYGLLAGAPEVKAGRVVVQNPVVNLNVVKAEAKAEPKVKINVNLDKIVNLIEFLYENRHRIPGFERKAVEDLYKEVRKSIN